MNKKDKAIEMRLNGKSYNEIKTDLNVAKSTLSMWLRHIPIVVLQKENKGAIANKLKWETKKQQIKTDYNPDMTDPEFVVGVALYWAEGVKYSKSRVSVTNMDFKLLLKFKKWIEKYFHGEFERFWVCVQYHEGEESENKLFWHEKLNIDEIDIKCIKIKTNKIPKKPIKHMHGMAQLQVCGDGVWKIRQKIDKAIDLLKG